MTEFPRLSRILNGMLFVAAMLSVSGLPSGPASAEPNIFLIGTYEIVAARRASDVAGGPEDADAEGLIGHVVVFGDGLTWVDGTECATWSTDEASDGPVVWVDDPLLSDLRLASRGRRGSFGQQREKLGWTVSCDGRHLGAVQLMDARVLVVPTPSGLTNLILERPLGMESIRKMQRALADHGHYSGPESGVLDAATRRAVALRAQELGAQYAFETGIVTVDILVDLIGE
jgi:hypothetical protein